MTVIQFDEAVCRKIRAKLDAYLNDELSVETAAEVDRHLKSCPKCAEELARMEGLRSRLRQAVEEEPTPGGLREAVSAGLNHEYRRKSVSWLAVAAAAAVLLIGGSFVSKRMTGFLPHELLAIELEVRNLVRQVASVYAPAIIDHLHCAIYRPGPKTELMPEKVAMELGAAAPVADIVRAAAPDAAMLVAHRCVFGDREYIHMILMEGEGLISVVLTEKRAGEELGAGLESTRVDRFEIAGFEAGGYLAFVISDMTPERNLELARALMDPVRALAL